MARLIRIVFLAVLLGTPAVGQTNLPAGTRLRVEMQTEVDTKTSHVGDVVEARLVEPVQEGDSILLPVGTRLTGRIVAVSAEDKKKQTHALLQLSFDNLALLDGRQLKTQASIQSLGINEKVDGDGVATIHPFAHDFGSRDRVTGAFRASPGAGVLVGAAAAVPADKGELILSHNFLPAIQNCHES